MGQYTPGYVDVPGKGRRYRDENGKYYHNHLGVPLTQIGNLFGNPGFGRTTEQHVIGDDGSIGGRVKPSRRSEPKPAAPAKPEPKTEPTPYRSRREGLDATYPDRVPSGGSGGSGGSSSRVSPTGVVQRGLDLGGVNSFLEGLGIGNLRDMSTVYSKTDTTEAQPVPTNMDGTEPEREFFEGLPGLTQTPQKTGTTATTPETTSKPGDMQDGASDQADLADQIRAVRVNRGARQQEFAERPGNQSSSEPKNSGTNWGARTMADNSDVRTRMRSAFLDDKIGSLQALRAAEKEAGVFKQNGKVFYNEGGELKQATENSTDFYRTAMSGKNPMEYADTPADLPAPAEISPVQAATAGMNMAPIEEQTEKPTISSVDAATAGQAFAQSYIDRVKKQNK